MIKTKYYNTYLNSYELIICSLFLNCSLILALFNYEFLIGFIIFMLIGPLITAWDERLKNKK